VFKNYLIFLQLLWQIYILYKYKLTTIFSSNKINEHPTKKYMSWYNFDLISIRNIHSGSGLGYKDALDGAAASSARLHTGSHRSKPATNLSTSSSTATAESRPRLTGTIPKERYSNKLWAQHLFINDNNCKFDVYLLILKGGGDAINQFNSKFHQFI
jgi:hypothetical protein